MKLLDGFVHIMVWQVRQAWFCFGVPGGWCELGYTEVFLAFATPRDPVITRSCSLCRCHSALR